MALAHRLGKPVFVHPNTGEDVLTAVRGGVDVIAHTTPQSGPWDETLLAAIKDHRVALIPTSGFGNGTPATTADPRRTRL